MIGCDEPGFGPIGIGGVRKSFERVCRRGWRGVVEAVSAKLVRCMCLGAWHGMMVAHGQRGELVSLAHLKCLSANRTVSDQTNPSRFDSRFVERGPSRQDRCRRQLLS